MNKAEGDLVQQAAAADLEIRVTTESTGGLTSLRYVLHSPSGKVDFFDIAIRGGQIRSRPADYQAALFETLEDLQLESSDSELEPEEIYAQLEALGQELYHELFPPELKAAYRRFRGVAETVLLISDEPWIPWELIKPYDDSDPSDVIDDDFLCCRFQLTRWLAGGRPPAAAIPVGQLAAIEAGSSPDGLEPLASAAEEFRFLGELAEEYAIEDSSLDDATYVRVTALLREQDLGLLHFTGHGEIDPEQPNASGFWLVDGRALKPRDLYGRIRTRLRQNRPLVFFNACHVARLSWSLTQLGGWAQRFVYDCGCGAFVGPQWTVGDEDATAFAKAFYEALKRGMTLGGAAHEARRALPAHSLGRLAYSFYGHPNGRLHLGTLREAVRFDVDRHLRGSWETQRVSPGQPPAGSGARVVEKAPQAPPDQVQSSTASVLHSAWTLLGSVNLIFVGILFLRNRSVPVLPGLKDSLQGDVAALFAVLGGLPFFYLTLYVATEYCSTVELPRPATELSIIQRVAARLPVAFKARIRGAGRFENAYQIFFLFLFVIVFMILQIYLYIRVTEADVWRQRERRVITTTFYASLTHYVPPGEAFLNDNYRIGSMDGRVGVEKTINNITYFPFWGAWFLLFAELIALGWVLRLLWKLGAASSPGEEESVPRPSRIPARHEPL